VKNRCITKKQNTQVREESWRWGGEGGTKRSILWHKGKVSFYSVTVDLYKSLAAFVFLKLYRHGLFMQWAAWNKWKRYHCTCIGTRQHYKRCISYVSTVLIYHFFHLLLLKFLLTAKWQFHKNVALTGVYVWKVGRHWCLYVFAIANYNCNVTAPLLSIFIILCLITGSLLNILPRQKDIRKVSYVWCSIKYF
jgi:hypothetical protein